MTFKIQLSDYSIIDIEKIVEYYYDLNKTTAKKYYNNILKYIKKLKKFPKMGRIVPELKDDFHDKYRETIYENYRIIYKIVEDSIIILRVIDGRSLLDMNFFE